MAWRLIGGENFRSDCFRIGVNFGISALLFLLGSTRAKVHKLDVGDPIKYIVSKYLREHFKERFIPRWGDFHVEYRKLR